MKKTFNKEFIEQNKSLIEQLVNNIENSEDLFNEENFIDQKIKSFCEFVLSKEIDDLKKNINALKFIYSVGGLSMFVRNGLLPLKDKLENATPEIEEEALKIICPKDKVKEIITKFTQKEKDQVRKFVNFLIDSEINGLL